MAIRKSPGAVLALAVSCCVLIPAPAALGAKATQQPPPVQFKVTEPTRPFALERVINQIPAGATIGEMYVDELCAFQNMPVHVEYAIAGKTAADFTLVFMTEAHEAGYKLPGESTNMIETQNAGKPEILIGAALQKVKVRGCKGIAVVGAPVSSMDAAMTVEWQVFDPLEKKMLFRGTTEGQAKTKAPIESVSIDAVRNAFQQAARALLADPRFVAAVRETSAEQQNASTGLGAAAEPASAGRRAVAPEQIPRVPLSVRTFQEQIPQIRQSVVTIRTASASGSGFLVADGLLLTNEHVVTGARRVKIKIFGGQEFDGEVIKSDARRDVALIAADSSRLGAILPLRLDPNSTPGIAACPCRDRAP